MKTQKTSEKEARKSIQLVDFRVDRKDYALDINKIIEIISYREVTPIPRLPSFIEGVVDLRGTVIPVIDLKKKLGLKIAANVLPNHILIVKVHGKKIGIIVDEVKEVIVIEEGSIQAPPDMFKGEKAEYLIGICKFKEKLILVLDAERIFSYDERDALRGIEEG